MFTSDQLELTREQAQEITDLLESPTPESLDVLLDKYGLVFTHRGQVIRVKGKPFELEQAVVTEEGERIDFSEKLKTARTEVLYHVVDKPILALKQRKANARRNRQQRVAEHEARKREKREAKTIAEAMEETGHTVAT